ncbi:MAG: hypothetical protein AB7V42_00260 [Thermoleophilia bacterium]
MAADLDRELAGGGPAAGHLAAMYRHTLRRLGPRPPDLAALREVVGDLEVLRDACAALSR